VDRTPCGDCAYTLREGGQNEGESWFHGPTHKQRGTHGPSVDVKQPAGRKEKKTGSMGNTSRTKGATVNWKKPLVN